MNEKDKNGNTALSFAIQTNHSKIVKLLHNYGSNIHEKNQGGLTPLMIASRAGYSELIAYFFVLVQFVRIDVVHSVRYVSNLNLSIRCLVTCQKYHT